jgi:hypothetical protein
MFRSTSLYSLQFPSSFPFPGFLFNFHLPMSLPVPSFHPTWQVIYSTSDWSPDNLDLNSSGNPHGSSLAVQGWHAGGSRHPQMSSSLGRQRSGAFPSVGLIYSACGMQHYCAREHDQMTVPYIIARTVQT